MPDTFVYCSDVKLQIIFPVCLEVALVALDFEAHVFDLDMFGKKKLFSRPVLAVLTLVLLAFVLGSNVDLEVAHGGVLLLAQVAGVLDSLVFGLDVKDESSSGGENVSALLALLLTVVLVTFLLLLHSLLLHFLLLLFLHLLRFRFSLLVFVVVHEILIVIIIH